MKIQKLWQQCIQNLFIKIIKKFSYKQNFHITNVPIKCCRHYCAYKYGSDSFNPYENYIKGLHEGIDRNNLKKNFEDFLLYFRPKNLDEIFGIEFSKNIPSWIFPWERKICKSRIKIWSQNIDCIPDIITHFCESGIKRSRIDEEYYWLENAYTMILQHGYKPYNYSFIEGIELVTNKKKVFIITDGNHRISALAAIGLKEVKIKIKNSIRWNNQTLKQWNNVYFGTYSPHDARKLLSIYFLGVNGFNRSNTPATILEDQ